MNPELSERLHPSPNPDSPPVPPPGFQWRDRARRLMVCNPFFLCSAALLLFGVNRLSIDPNFLGEEKSNLLFNYFALQMYEALVVTTAIVLARRKIWYDSALLVVVENGLVLVPFLLISQATLLAQSLGMKLAIGAFALAVARAVVIRRGYPQFNLPPRALLFGAALLLLNAALPAIFPSVVEKDTDDWMTPNLVLWYVALPLLVAGANLLPRPARYGGLNPERHWLPLFTYALWVTGTGVHIWCLGYITKQEFHPQLLGPAAVIATWTLWHRIGDFVLRPNARWEMALLGLTYVAPLISHGNPALFESLVVLNCVAYAVLLPGKSGATRTLLRELVFTSLGMLLLNMPEEISHVLLPTFARAHPAILAAATMICLCALRWFRVGPGIAGAVAAAIIALLLWPTAPSDLFVQVAVVFLLAHSLAWYNNNTLALLLRAMAGALWIIDAAMWVHHSGWQTGVAITSTAIAMLIACFLVWRFKQHRDWIVGVSAVAVAVVMPADWLVRQGSQGLLALVASLATFAIGFGVAWTRHRWERANQVAHQ